MLTVFEMGQEVLFRRGTHEIEERGRIVGRTLKGEFYDIETADGERVLNLSIVRKDDRSEA